MQGTWEAVERGPADKQNPLPKCFFFFNRNYKLLCDANALPVWKQIKFVFSSSLHYIVISAALSAQINCPNKLGLIGYSPSA